MTEKDGEEAEPSWCQFWEGSRLGTVLGRAIPSLLPSQQSKGGVEGMAKAVS